MIRIYFTSPGTNHIDLLNRLKYNTPKLKGIWKDIEGTTDINNFDYMVILDDLHKNLLDMGQNKFLTTIKNLDNLIYFQRENTHLIKQGSWFRKNILVKLNNNYSYEDNYMFTFTSANFLNKSYDELKALKYPNKTKNLSAIVSSKDFGDTYKKRKNFLINYSNKNENIDIYGRGWNKAILGNNYKGELDSKFDGLILYNYSICLENFPNEKITSEKITDALLCWCLPIYSGSIYTDKLYPSNSFKLIDINTDKCIENVVNISNNNITQNQINAIGNARELILDKYNIWEQIYQIIHNKKNFDLLYKYTCN
tara:strand:+ start:3422 stop:4354 length:933 start_codon:yes stop_codon:yes gene_type:complete